MPHRSLSRLLLVALSVGFVMTSTTTSIRPQARADEPTQQVNETGPVLDQWTPTTQVVRNEDGTLTSSVWSLPVQAPDPSSDTGWSPINTTLAQTGDTISPEQTDPNISFSSGTGQAPLATMAQDGASLSVDLPGDVPTPTISGDTATYPDVAPGVDATLQARPAGFEQSFVVDAPEHAPATLDIPLTLNGLTASLTDGGALVLTDDQGSQVGGADPAVMYGAATDPVTGDPTVQQLVPAALVDGQNGPVLRLTPDLAFFANPEVQFPVTIDPAVNLSLQVDTYVQQSTPTTGYSSAPTLRSGKWSTGDLFRSYIGFDRTAVAGKHVLSASLGLYQIGAGSCTATQADVYSVTNVVTPPITWNNQPTEGYLYASASAAYGATSCPSPGLVTFSTGGANGNTMTSLVQKWADGSTPPAMVEVRAHDEADSTASKTFNSSEASSNQPVLSVTYNSYPDSPTAMYASEDTGSPVLHGIFSDPDASTGSVQYTLYDSVGASVFTASGTANTPSGSDSPYTIPAGVLQPGANYTWKARSFDGTDYSAYSELLTYVPITQVSSDPYDGNGSGLEQSHATEVEPDTFSYGSTIVGAFQAGKYAAAGASNIGWAASINNGATWTNGFLPHTTRWAPNPDPTWERINDPSVAFDTKHNVWMISGLPLKADASAYKVYVSVGTVSQGTWSWAVPVTVASGTQGVAAWDKDWIGCDNWSTSLYRGNCYVVWKDLVTNLLYLSYSTNGGGIWSTTPYPSTFTGHAPQVVVLRNGDVLIAYTDGTGTAELDSTVFSPLTNSFSTPITISTCQYNKAAGNLRDNPCYPSAEIDSAGTVYVAWQDCRFRVPAGFSCNQQDHSGPSDLVFSTLPEGATSWSGPNAIPIALETSAKDFFLPGMGVDRTTAGRLAVAFYSYSNWSCGTQSNPCRLYAGLISSTNGGTTWSTPHSVLGPIQLSWLANAPGSCPTCTSRMIGDYISGSFGSNGRAYPVFSTAQAPVDVCDHNTYPNDLGCRQAMVAPTTGIAVG